MLETSKRNYTYQKNKVTAQIRSEKIKYIEKLTQDGLGDSKRMWQAMNLIFRKGKSNVQAETPESILNDENGTVISNKTETLETLNRYFVNVGQNIQEQLKINFCSKPQQMTTSTEANTTIYLYKTTSNELKRIIDTLKTNAASGLDEICAKDLKKVSRNLSKALVDPINNCLKDGYFPHIFKETKVREYLQGQWQS